MRKSFYCRAVLFLVCLVTLMHTGVVQAGEINANEAKLVSAASGTFIYEGKLYRASSQYVSELCAYLNRDDVDLAAGDVASLLSDMYSNVEAGVRDNYLEEIGDVPKTEEATSEEKPVEADEEENAEPDEADSKEQKTDQTDQTEKAETEAETKIENIIVSEQPVYFSEATQDGTNLVDVKGEIIFTAKSVIKNTGYHTQSARGILILGILALASICGGIYLVSKHEKA